MRKVFSVLVIASIAVTAVWAQDDDKLGVTVSTELEFGNIAMPRYTLVTTDVKNADNQPYQEGQAVWTLPKIEYAHNFGTLTFEGLLSAQLTNGYAGPQNEIITIYSLKRETMAKFTYRPDDRVKLWATLGDDYLFRFGGGRSAFNGVVTPSIEVLLDAVQHDGTTHAGGQGDTPGQFNLNEGIVEIRPRIDVNVGVFGAYLFLAFEPVNEYHFINERNTRALKELEFRVYLTFSRIYVELTTNIPMGVFEGRFDYTDAESNQSPLHPRTPDNPYGDPVSIRYKGVTITPKVEFGLFDALKVWVKFDLDGIGKQLTTDRRTGDEYGFGFVPYLGVSYSL